MTDPAAADLEQTSPLPLADVVDEPHLVVPAEPAKWSSRMGMWWFVVFVAASALFALRGSTVVTWSLFVLMAGGLMARGLFRSLRFQKAIGLGQVLLQEQQFNDARALFDAMAHDAEHQQHVRAAAVVHLAGIALREGDADRTLQLLSSLERAPLFVGGLKPLAEESAVFMTLAYVMKGDLDAGRRWVEEVHHRLPGGAAVLAWVSLFLMAREERFHTAVDAVNAFAEPLHEALDDVFWQQLQAVRAFCVANTPEGKETPDDIKALLDGVDRRWAVVWADHWPAFAAFLDGRLPPAAFAASAHRP